jgi:hypothetical protein
VNLLCCVLAHCSASFFLLTLTIDYVPAPFGALEAFLAWIASRLGARISRF